MSVMSGLSNLYSLQHIIRFHSNISSEIIEKKTSFSKKKDDNLRRLK